MKEKIKCFNVARLKDTYIFIYTRYGTLMPRRLQSKTSLACEVKFKREGVENSFLSSSYCDSFSCSKPEIIRMWAFVENKQPLFFWQGFITIFR